MTCDRGSLSMEMGKPISEEIQWIIVHLSSAMSREDIAMYTGVSQRKVNDVISTFNKDGTVKVYTRQKPHTYASLREDDVQVSLCYPYAHQLSQATGADMGMRPAPAIKPTATLLVQLTKPIKVYHHSTIGTAYCTETKVGTGGYRPYSIQT
jgi:hypothetical protein